MNLTVAIPADATATTPATPNPAPAPRKPEPKLGPTVGHPVERVNERDPHGDSMELVVTVGRARPAAEHRRLVRDLELTFDHSKELVYAAVTDAENTDGVLTELRERE